MPNSPEITYDNPPLVEVVCGLKFEALQNLSAPHFGLFWHRIRNEFPNCQLAPPLAPIVENKITGLPEARVWLINELGNHLIQLENNKFIFNWRENDNEIEESKSYPRFKNVLNEFLKNYQYYIKFLDEEKIGEIELKEFELTYINHITEENGWRDFQEIGKIFPDITWRLGEGRIFNNPISFDIRVGLANFEYGVVFAKIKSAQRIDTDKKIFIFEISVKGEAKNNIEIEDWFDFAHEKINQSFEDLTNNDVQKKYWRKA